MRALQEVVTDKRIGTNLCADVIENLKTVKYCGIQKEDAEMPFWISGPDTECCHTRFLNGIIDVTAVINGDHTLVPLTPDFFARQQVNFSFDPTAQCPRWLKYLE